MSARDVFSPKELAALRGFPEIGREELIRYFTLTAADEVFVRGKRSPAMLGLAVQMCSLSWLGFVPDYLAGAPMAAVERLAVKLGVPVDALSGYGTREQTRTDHLREVMAYLGWRNPDLQTTKELDEFLLARAMEHDSPSLLFRLACEHLRTARVVRPGPVKLLERVATARARAERETYDRIAHLLTEPRRGELDALLVTDPEIGMSRLRWLGTGPTEASAAAVKMEVRKLKFLRGLDAHSLDLSSLPAGNPAGTRRPGHPRRGGRRRAAESDRDEPAARRPGRTRDGPVAARPRACFGPRRTTLAGRCATPAPNSCGESTAPRRVRGSDCISCDTVTPPNSSTAASRSRPCGNGWGTRRYLRHCCMRKSLTAPQTTKSAPGDVADAAHPA